MDIQHRSDGSRGDCYHHGLFVWAEIFPLVPDIGHAATEALMIFIHASNCNSFCLHRTCRFILDLEAAMKPLGLLHQDFMFFTPVKAALVCPSEKIPCFLRYGLPCLFIVVGIVLKESIHIHPMFPTICDPFQIVDVGKGKRAVHKGMEVVVHEKDYRPSRLYYFGYI